MNAQVFKAKSGSQYRLIYWLVLIMVIHYFLREFDYSAWIIVLSIVLVVVVLLLSRYENVQLRVDEFGIHQQPVYPRFALLNRRFCFSVAYADISYIEVLGYNDTAYFLNISSNRQQKQVVAASKYPDLQAIINSIQGFKPFDATPVLPVGLGYELEGRRINQLMLASFILLALSFVLKDFLACWHPHQEHFALLVAKLSPLTFFLVYFYIRGENKQHVHKIFLLPAILLTSAIALGVTGLNRYYTEHYGKPQTYRFVLESGSADQQRWYLPEQLVVDKAYIDLYRHSKVDYQHGLPQYYVYAIQVKTGYLNDWVFAPNAFKQARQLEKAHLKKLSNP